MAHVIPLTSNEKVKSQDDIERYRAPILQQQYAHPHSTYPSKHRFVRFILAPVLLLIMLWSLFRAAFVFNHHYCPGKILSKQTNSEQIIVIDSANRTLIPFEAHIMSKCPDARDCLKDMVVPAMVQISDKVDFKLSYIGSIDPDSDAVSCMHGPGECLGNIIQLCAAKIYPDPKLYLGFANCMISDYKNIPQRDLVEDCALEHGLDFQTLNTCISDEGEGIDLLRASIQRSQLNNVRKSCTVRLAGKVRCIRDGGEWYDCPGGSDTSNLVDEIKKLYQDANH